MAIDFRKMAEEKKAAVELETKSKEQAWQAEKDAHQLKMDGAVKLLRDHVYPEIEEALAGFRAAGVHVELQEIFDKGNPKSFVAPKVIVKTTTPPRAGDGYKGTTAAIAVECDGKNITFYKASDSLSDPKIRIGSSRPDEGSGLVEQSFEGLIEAHYKVMSTYPYKTY